MTQDLADLLSTYRGERTWKELSQDCGGVPSASRLANMSRQPIEGFPVVEAIKNMATGLGVPTHRVVEACSVSLGLKGTDAGPEGRPFVLPDYASTLTESQRRIIMSMAREFAQLNARLPADD